MIDQSPCAEEGATLPSEADFLRETIKVVEWQRDEARKQRNAAEASASALRDRVAMLESALKLAIPFVDFAAGDDLVFPGNADNGRPEMDAQVICQAMADLLGVDLHEEGFEAWRDEGFPAIAALKESTHV